MEKPLAIGAVTPSGKALARTMAGYVDPAADGPVIELGPGTGPVTEALVEHGIDPARLVLVEFDPTFCRLLRERYPAATVVQGDAYSLRRRWPRCCAAGGAVVSGLPLFNKPLKMRLRLLGQAFGLMLPARRSCSSPTTRSRRSRARMAASARKPRSGSGAISRPRASGSTGRADGGGQTTEEPLFCPLSSVLCRPDSHGSPKILVFPGSLRSESYNVRLAALATKELIAGRCRRHPHLARRLSAADLRRRHRGTVGTAAQRAQAQAARRRAQRHLHREPGIQRLDHAAAEEHHRLDLDGARSGEPQLAAFQNRVFALGGASPGRSGAMQSLLALRQVLAVGCRALVIPEQVTIPNAEQAFDEDDELADAAPRRSSSSWCASLSTMRVCMVEGIG